MKIKEHQIDLMVHGYVAINVLNSDEVTAVACFSTVRFVKGTTLAYYNPFPCNY